MIRESWNKYQRDWRHKNKDKAEYLNKRSMERNPATTKLKRLRRSAKVRGVAMSIDLVEFKAWYLKQDRTCVFCGIPETDIAKIHPKQFGLLTVDRIDNSIGYEIENICLACYKCNTKKGDDVPFSVMLEIGQKYLRPLWLKRIAEVEHG